MDMKQEHLDLLRAKIQSDFSKSEQVTHPLSEKQADAVNTSAVVEQQNGDASKVEQSKGKGSLKEKIEQLEREIESYTSKTAVPYDVKTDTRVYTDEYGNETFYYKNISGGHVIVSDLAGGIKIPVGESIDLLRYADADQIKKSRDLKIASNPYSGNQWLVRLTEQEFFEEKARFAENLRRKRTLHQQMEERSRAVETGNPAVNPPIRSNETSRNIGTEASNLRTDIQSRLHKLSLYYDNNPEVAKYGMDPISFVEWVYATKLSADEIDMILGHPSVMRNPEIKTALLHKKSKLV